MFETKLEKILEKVESIEPADYGRTRNFLNGDVSKLSPYISRGLISTRYVFESTLKRGFDPERVQKFIQELAWRDYFQNVWRVKEELINKDLRQRQSDVENFEMPITVIDGLTGIEAVDAGIKALYENGYVHNHVRMYIASIACNLGKSHWQVPAKWFYFHLLDADWGSNALSWQWVAGTFSGKKYYANQENVNRFCETSQHQTFLDIDYNDFSKIPIPDELRETALPDLKTLLPENFDILVDNTVPTLIYNFYNLDPFWRKDQKANRILLLEPTHFEKYPVSAKVLDFAIELSKNIDGIQVFCGEFGELASRFGLSNYIFKEHPTNRHYTGEIDERDWMFPETRGFYSSFFKYWKKCEIFITRQQKLF